MTTIQHPGSVRDRLPPPHGGELVDLLVSPPRAAHLKTQSRNWPSWDLTARQVCDLELLLNGGFSPLRSFLSRADYESVCNRMRLANGLLWPMPIMLDVSDDFAKGLSSGTPIALRDPEGIMLAVLHVAQTWQPDRHAEAEAIYGTTSLDHPGVFHLLERPHSWYIEGELEGVQLPPHYDFRALRLTPAELRAEFIQCGWQRVIGFHTHNLMHRAQVELTLRASKQVEANLLIHPSVGMTSRRDADYYVRIRCYQELIAKYPKGAAKLSLLPLASRMAGSREALWHAIVRKNFGCTHFIAEQPQKRSADAANPSVVQSAGASEELLDAHQKELGIDLLPLPTMVYLQDKAMYLPTNEVQNGSRISDISDAELRDRLSEGREIPEWFTFSEVVRELRRTYPPRDQQGFTVFFTGLSGSGKSTIANVLLVRLLEMGGRPVTLLDGDIVRKNLSSELGFSHEHRDLNIKRIGFVASEITKNGGIAICAPIAPYDAVRKQVRAMIEPHGAFVLVHLCTPLEVCEGRDRKGLYAKARAGLIQHFTGISDPYEAPQDAEIVADTSNLAPEETAKQIFLHLEHVGFIGADNAGLGSPRS